MVVKLNLFGEPEFIDFLKAFYAQCLKSSAFGIDPLDFEKHCHFFFNPNTKMIGVIGNGDF